MNLLFQSLFTYIYFMNSKRNFLKAAGMLAAGSVLSPALAKSVFRPQYKAGIQLYSVKELMLADPAGALKQLAKIGYREVESARSNKGNYYGLKPKEIKTITQDLGIKLVSGHVQIDQNWQQAVDEAAEAGQEYLICSVLPAEGQTVENYQRSADRFNKAGEECKKANVTFGYHNHVNEFEKAGNQTLYNILLDRTDPALVKMEMDLGWVIAAGSSPQHYFDQYPGRFPLWHLKDMNVAKRESTELGKGDINIADLFKNAGKSGMKHFFVEQEEYTRPVLVSCQYNYDYLEKLKVL